MSLSDELAYTSATEIALRIRRRDLSPVEVIDAFISRIEARNPSINAFIFKGFDDARKAAKAAEHAVMSGAALGRLHGVPCAIKDLFDFKPGWPCTFGGVRAMKNYIAHWHCGFAESMEKAGAIILGKTNAPTMGFRGTCDNYLFGPSRNPFDVRKNTGGSSGGSAGAVADGLVPMAEGTDAGGSIRIPAAWCGAVGFMPSFGIVPQVMRPNAFAATDPFVFEGPITRTVEDAALTLSAQVRYDPRDPYSVPCDQDFVAAVRGSIKGWKIAYSPDFDIFPVAPEVRAVVDKAVEAFREAGATVEPVKLGIKRNQRELSDAWCRIIMPLNMSSLEAMRAQGMDLIKDHRADFPPEYLKWVEWGQTQTAMDLFRDQAIRTELFDAVQGVLNTHQLLITPTLACLPVDNATDGNTKGPTHINGVEIDPLLGWTLTYIANFTGHPAVTVPAGLSGGLPVGMQIMGRRYGDSDLFAAAGAFERLRPWQQHYKICAGRKI